MARSIWKGPITNLNISPNKLILRSSIILPYCVGKSFIVGNGKNSFPISINLKMIKYKFGEFVFTRKLPNHKKFLNKFSPKKK